MNSTVKKRSIVIGRQKTSISLEDDFWTSLWQIARSRQVTISHLIASLNATRENGNLSSAIRVFVLDHYCTMAVANRQRNREFAQVQVAVANVCEVAQAAASVNRPVQ